MPCLSASHSIGAALARSWDSGKLVGSDCGVLDLAARQLILPLALGLLGLGHRAEAAPLPHGAQLDLYPPPPGDDAFLLVWLDRHLSSTPLRWGCRRWGCISVRRADRRHRPWALSRSGRLGDPLEVGSGRRPCDLAHIQ